MMEVTTRTLARRQRMTDHERKKPFLRCLLSLGNQKAVEFWVHSFFFLRRFDKDAFDNASLIYAQWFVLFFWHITKRLRTRDKVCSFWICLTVQMHFVIFQELVICISKIQSGRVWWWDPTWTKEENKKMLWTLHIKRRVCFEASFSFSTRAHLCLILTS